MGVRPVTSVLSTPPTFLPHFLVPDMLPQSAAIPRGLVVLRPLAVVSGGREMAAFPATMTQCLWAENSSDGFENWLNRLAVLDPCFAVCAEFAKCPLVTEGTVCAAPTGRSAMRLLSVMPVPFKYTAGGRSAFSADGGDVAAGTGKRSSNFVRGTSLHWSKNWPPVEVPLKCIVPSLPTNGRATVWQSATVCRTIRTDYPQNLQCGRRCSCGRKDGRPLRKST
jgi:hypothetical protein